MARCGLAPEQKVELVMLGLNSPSESLALLFISLKEESRVEILDKVFHCCEEAGKIPISVNNLPYAQCRAI